MSLNINFKQPKYVIPLILLPFIVLFFYVYQTSIKESKPELKPEAGMQGQIGTASADVQQKAFDDKLDAFNQQYKEADGNSAVNPISDDQAGMDSIDRAMKERFLSGGNGTMPYASGLSPQRQGMARLSKEDQALSQALAALNKPDQGYAGAGYNPYAPPVLSPSTQAVAAPPQKDPMELFKAQMAYMDSVSKAADPEVKAEQLRQKELEKAEHLRASQTKLEVQKDASYSSVFNTLLPGKQDNQFITAMIDENLTGYAGSRIRLRLLEDIRAGNTLVKKGTYLYALVTGFGDQRITLSVTSILQSGKILPVKLDLYDASDGLPGLYVPESAFREFTKDLGGNSMQGVNLQGGTAANQFMMSSFDKVFQSTSSAIASMIRKNKAKIKYNSYLYLIDPEALQNAQKGY